MCIRDRCKAEECIYESVCENLSVIPANMNLAAVEIELIDAEEKEYILKRELDTVREKYDFILIAVSYTHLIAAKARMVEKYNEKNKK